MKKLKRWFMSLSRLSQALLISFGLILTLGASGSFAQQNDNPIQSRPDDAVDTNQSPEPIVTFREEKTTEPISFTSSSYDDSNLDSGTNEVKTKGVDGERTKTFRITLMEGKETNRELIDDKVTRQPINEVIANGTYVRPEPVVRSDCDTNYSGCVPNVSYDLDCPDIGFSVIVKGYDVHGFDRDGDGYGCESY